MSIPETTDAPEATDAPTIEGAGPPSPESAADFDAGAYLRGLLIKMATVSAAHNMMLRQQAATIGQLSGEVASLRELVGHAAPVAVVDGFAFDPAGLDKLLGEVGAILGGLSSAAPADSPAGATEGGAA